jgi:hypothetical protein
VPFTFDHLSARGMAQFFGLTAADQPLADVMHGAMVRFVSGATPAAPGLPTWQTYDAKTRATMVLDHTPPWPATPTGWNAGSGANRALYAARAGASRVCSAPLALTTRWRA